MNDLINNYIRLNLAIGSSIIISYYTTYGTKITKKVKLLHIYKYSYITILDNNKKITIHFFSPDCIIEYIKHNNTNYYLYQNPYVNKDIYNDKYVKEEEFYKIRKKILGAYLIDFDKIDEQLENYLSKYRPLTYNELFFSKKQQEEFENFFEIIIKEIIKNSKMKNNISLQYVSSGTSSLVYSLGDKIIKIGKPRWINEIPYCEYLLQPIINKTFIFDGYPIHIEITEKVKVLDNELDTKNYTEMGKKLKKILSSIGLSAKDLHSDNVGILLKDNKIHYKSINYDVSNENATSIINNNNFKILPAGSPVIIDLDLIEIKDIKKYTKYLQEIGYIINEDTIKKQKTYTLTK